MRVLITNSQTRQTYSIILCLRETADRIVVTMDGTNRFRARTANTANSRFVDARYYVPRPDLDWHAGRIQPGNTEREERYVQRIEEVCRLESIDTIFPSFDPHVYVFAKNKQRFEENGIVIVGPDHEQVLAPLDKYSSVKAAEGAGLPVPRTFLPGDDTQIDEVPDLIGPPWVIKPRYTAGSEGQVYVTERKALKETYHAVNRKHKGPIIQEFIPGNGKMNLYVMCDRNSELVSFFAPSVVRISRRLFRNSTASAISSSNCAYRPQVEKLVKSLKWWGGLTIQTKVDARDGQPKFMEMNPRLGTTLWLRTELGVNEPLNYVKLARREPVKPETFPEDVLLLDPFEDLVGFPFEWLDLVRFRLRTGLFRARPTDPLNSPPSFVEMLKGYATDYLPRRKRKFSPHTCNLLNDPLPCLLWYYTYLGYSIKSLKHVGK
jgi:hypothetical protein